MVISGFKNPLITVSYLVAMVFLWLHLWHGVYSMFQSLGLIGSCCRTFFRRLGPVVATIVLIGNCSIPLAVSLGLGCCQVLKDHSPDALGGGASRR